MKSDLIFLLKLVLLQTIVQSSAKIDLDNETWILHHMMGNVQDLQDHHGWFDPDDPNPCDWSYITCDHNNRVIALGDFIMLVEIM